MARIIQKPVIDKELAENARQMVEFGFWKYLDRFMSELEREAQQKADAIPLDRPSAAYAFAESRGVRSAIKRIRDEVEQYTI